MNPRTTGLLELSTAQAPDPALATVLLFAGVASAAVFGLGLATYARRKRGSYVLVTAAFGLLFARTVVGGLTAVGYVGTWSHHLLEHGLDFLMAGLVIGAVYYARGAERGADVDDVGTETDGGAARFDGRPSSAGEREPGVEGGDRR